MEESCVEGSPRNVIKFVVMLVYTTHPHVVVTVHEVHQRIYSKKTSCTKVGCVVRTNMPVPERVLIGYNGSSSHAGGILWKT